MKISSNSIKKFLVFLKVRRIISIFLIGTILFLSIVGQSEARRVYVNSINQSDSYLMEFIDPESQCDYLIYHPQHLSIAGWVNFKNMSSGKIDYSGTNVGTLFRMAVNSGSRVGNKKMCFKEGRFTLDVGLYAQKNLTVKGMGIQRTFIEGANNVNVLFFGNNTPVVNFTVQDMTLMGNGSRIFDLSLAPGRSVWFNKNINIIRVDSERSRSHAFSIWDTDGFLVEKCLVGNATLNGVDIQYSKNGIIRGCSINGTGAHGIDVGGYNANWSLGNVIIENNHVTNSSRNKTRYNDSAAIVLAATVSDSIIRGNTVSHGYDGIRLSGKNNIADSNTATDFRSDAIKISATANNCKVTNNKVRESNNGIYIEASYCVVTDNIASDNYYRGIHILNTNFNTVSNNILIRNNRADGANDTTLTAYLSRLIRDVQIITNWILG